MTQSPETNLNKRTTQSLEAKTEREQERSKWFFIRRAPFRPVPREWERPPDEEYQRLLMEEGFIAPALVTHPLSAELQEDLRELDQHLLPHFWRMNQRARFFQNRYYQYRWTFILSALLTTALAAFNVFFYAQGWSGENSAGTLVGPVQWTEILGFLTAVVSGVAAGVSFLDANQTPQKRWFKARVQAEILRSLYFLYLARQKPFDTPSARERVQRMRSKVIDVLRETVVTNQPQSDTATPPQTGTPASALRRGRRTTGSDN